MSYFRSIDPDSDRFLASATVMQARASRAQSQLTTGLRVARPSDGPGEVADILQLRGDLARIAQTEVNLDRVRNEVDAAESALGTSLQIIDQVRALAAEGASNVNPEKRPELAAQVLYHLDRLVTASRANVEGRYVFSGDIDLDGAYEFDSSVPGSVTQLQQTANSRLVEDAHGNRFAVGRGAQQIFDIRDSGGLPASGNAFHALDQLRLALEADDQAGIEAAVTLVDDAQRYLSRQLSFYGGVQNRVYDAIDDASRLELQEQGTLAALAEADITAAALELTQVETQQEAAFSAQASRRRRTLFSYLG